MIQNCSYLNTINYSKNGLEEKLIFKYYTERAGMDGLLQISIRTAIIRGKQLLLLNLNSENYSEAMLIYHGIAQITIRMMKIVFFLHLPTNKNFRSKMIKNNMQYFVILVMDQVLDMDMIFIFVTIPTHQMTVIQIYQATNNLKILE